MIINGAIQIFIAHTLITIMHQEKEDTQAEQQV